MAVPPLICCDGMLRSGSAFQYNLVCSLLAKMGPCVRHGRLEREEESSAPVFEWAQDSNSFHVAKSASYDFVMGIDGRQMHIDQANFVFKVKEIEASRYHRLRRRQRDT